MEARALDPAGVPEGAGFVLVVDDSALVRRIIGGHLRQAGYRVAEAADGAAAIQMARETDFDVIVTDLQMPKLDGFGVLEAVKTQGMATEVIILTGTHAEDMASAVRALRLGAHDFLTKPPPTAEDVVFTVGRAVEKKRLRDANRRLLRELEALSRTDALTGALNRRVFDEVLSGEIVRAARHGHPLSMLLMDIDHFKRVNDTCGHPAGDAVLKGFVRRASQALRAHEPLYRHGGEEFTALLAHTDAPGALAAARRVVAATAAAPFETDAGPLGLTVSIGVASYSAPQSAGALVAAADAALYVAKKGGRNRAAAGPP